MPARFLGAHMSTSGGGVAGAVRNAKALGATALQVFTSSPRQWRAREVTDQMAIEGMQAMLETGITDIVSHDSYLMNLCAPELDMREKSIHRLIGELDRCAKYQIPLVVSHMGSHKGHGEEAGLEAIARSLKTVLDKTSEYVTVCMETTAGQGSALMSRFEHLARVLELVEGHPRVAVCLDTCHVFVAGYDIRDDVAFDFTFSEFDRIIGLDRLRVIHCNDSKKGLGSRVDRHEHIGCGEIGEHAFRRLVTDSRFDDIPILLETDGSENGHERDLAKLKELQGEK